MHNQWMPTCLCSTFRDAWNSFLSELLTAQWAANVLVPLGVAGLGIYATYRVFVGQRAHTEADQIAEKNQAFAGSYAVKVRAAAAQLDTLYHGMYASDTGAAAHHKYMSELLKVCTNASDAADLFAEQADQTGHLTDAAKTVPSVYLARLISIRHHSDITDNLGDIQSYVVRQQIHQLTGLQAALFLRKVAIAADKWDGRAQQEVTAISVLDPPPRKRAETIEEFELVSAEYRRWAGEQADKLARDLDDLREVVGKARLSLRPGGH